MDVMNQEFQMIFQSAGILAAGSAVLIGLCGLLTLMTDFGLLAFMTDLAARSRQEKGRTARNTR